MALRWRDGRYDADIVIGDFCTRKDTGQRYFVSAVPAPNNPDLVQITPMVPHTDPKLTTESVKVTELAYLLPVEPVEYKLKDEINTAVSVAVQNHIMNHTVFMSHGKEPLGTGTLIKSQGVHGILTASHCLHGENLKADVVFGKRNGKFLHLSTDTRSRSAISIPCEDLREIPVARREDGQYDWDGPDVTFIAIPNDWVGSIAAIMSFVDVDEQLRNTSEPLKDSTVFAVGYPMQKSAPITNTDGVEIGLSLQLMIMNAGSLFNLNTPVLNGYEYIEFPTQIEQSGRNDIPTDFSGVSGGGVWCFRILLDNVDGKPVVTSTLAQLSGVIYREYGPYKDSEGVLSIDIRSHFYNVLDHLQEKVIASQSHAALH